ncbi:MAG: hypothetical protein HXX17_03775 [Geobacteraceae bacterium]|nr:hypothetical protein [Geobacteraceae bacterium]
MDIESFLQNLKVRLDAVTSADELLKPIATGIAGFFSLRDHEVGVFAVNHKKHEIAFLWPQGVTTGHIPLKAMNSLVAKTANELVTTLDNSFAKSRHLFIFEFMLAEKSDRIPIQKIMSVPVIANGESKAVIQVVRKGADIADAGEDFTDQDLSALVKIADLLALYNLQGA